MKGKMKIVVETIQETGDFPITDTWEYIIDNTFESLEQWLELFRKILCTQGFDSYTLKTEED